MDKAYAVVAPHLSSNVNSKDYTVAFGRMTPLRNRTNKDSRHTSNEEKKEDTKSYKSKPHVGLRKSIPHNDGHINIAGEPASTTKKIKVTSVKKIDSQKPEKQFRPSQIPRRNYNLIKKRPSKEKHQVLIQNRNVQRVEICNTSPDFREMIDLPASLATTRPIPTLGQIYGNSVISSDIYNDFFLGSFNENTGYERAEQSNITRNVSPAGRSNLSNDENSQIGDESKNDSSTKTVKCHEKVFKTTNDNVKDWLSSELDRPTRDNESGYHSISPNRKYITRVHSNSSKDSKADLIRKYSLLIKNRRAAKKSVSTTNISKQSSGKSLTPKSTKFLSNNHELKVINQCVLQKMNTDTQPLKPTDPAFYATFKFPSSPNPAHNHDNCSAAVPSYVECPSEVLQKTTNFEIEGRDTTSTLNGRDADIQDDVSSQAACEHLDDFSEATDHYDWILPSSQCSAIFKTSKESNSTVSSWRVRRDDLSSDLSVFKYPDVRNHSDNCSYHEYFYHYCWRKEVVGRDSDRQYLRDSLGRCKKCQKYRRHANKRTKISKRFVNLKNRMKISRVCKHRLNRVWKKTTQRFSDWSKSTSKYTKLRMMHYLQRYHWDNADVQTTVLVYHETGTDAVAKTLASAAISTHCAEITSKRNESVGSSTSTTYKPRTNHVNVGPSIFPFTKESKPRMVSEAVSALKTKPITDVIKTKEIPNIIENSKIVETEATCLISTSTSLENLSISKVDKSSVTESVSLPTNNVKNTLSYLNDEVPRGVCAPNMMITCHNAATDIKFNPIVEATATTSSAACCDSFITNESNSNNKENFNPIFEDPPTTSSSACCDSSQIDKNNYNTASIMETSEKSNTKISTGTITFDSSFRDTASVVTDTIVPCRRLENKGFAKLTTPKGTVLSCAGTKITSVSSVNLQTCPVFCRADTTNTGMATNFVATRNTQCYTAPSLFRRRQRDTSIGLDVTPEDLKHDGSTSTTNIGDGFKHNIAVSTTKLIDKVSFNCGSPHTQRSFNDDFRPSMSSVFTNTEVEMTSEPIVLPLLAEDIKNTADTFVQYSNKGRDDSLDSGRIGRSRLMTVRMLGDSVSEMATQVQPLLTNAETHTIPKGVTSASVLTSHFIFDDILKQKTPKENDKDSSNPDANIKINSSQTKMPSNKDIQSKTSRAKSASRFEQKKSSRVTVQPRHPSVVISSNLNARKWMNGCAKEDYQSIIDISEMTVSESLERATLAVTTSNAFKSSDMSGVNQNAAVNCVTAKPLGVISAVDLADAIPVRDVEREDVKISRHIAEVMEDKLTSDTNKESSLQMRPTVCDTGVNVKLPLLIERKSATVLTSRHILTKPQQCQQNDCQNAECLYIYDRARCVVHNQRVDAGIQIKSTHLRMGHRNKEKKCYHRENRTVGLATSVITPSCCHKQTSSLLSEVMSPKVYKTLYETSRLIAKERSLSKEIKNVRNEAGNRSMQAVMHSLTYVTCPYCAKKYNTTSVNGDSDINDDWIEAQLARSCRYYSNLLSKNITRMKENFKKRLPIPVYRAATPQTFVEACTMKPSGRQDEKCQAKCSQYLCENCILSPTTSAIDIRGEERNDLQAVYCILSAIEGRVRRLKQNL